MAPCPLRSVLTKPPHKTPVLLFLAEGDQHWHPPPPWIQVTTNISSYSHWTMARLFVFLRGGEQIHQRKQKHFENWISMPFFTFGLRYTRQTADVELCWEGIEVSHRGGVLFHRVPPGGTRPVWPEIAMLEMWQEKKGPATPLMDWLTNYLAGWLSGRLTDREAVKGEV